MVLEGLNIRMGQKEDNKNFAAKQQVNILVEVCQADKY